VGAGVWLDVGVIVCVTAGIGVVVRDGVLVSTNELVICSGDDMAVRLGSIPDTLEQLAITIIREDKNIRLTRSLAKK
jgi:hypothetical protein